MTEINEVLAINYEEMDVYQVIAAISDRVGWVSKDGEVNFRGTRYNFTSEVGFISALKPLMDEYGLVVYPRNTHIVNHADEDNIYITLQYVFVASKYQGDGERQVTVETGGAGSTRDDKGIYKAMTGAFKYALRQAFRIPTGDDPETNEDVENTFLIKFEEKLAGIGKEITDKDVSAALENVGLSKKSLMGKPSRKIKSAAVAVFKELSNE